MKEEPLVVDSSEYLKKSKKLKVLYIILGSTFIILSIVFFILNDNILNYLLAGLYLITGILNLFLALGMPEKYKQYIRIDEIQIVWKFMFSKEKCVQWEHVNSINLKPTLIEFKVDNNSHDLNIGNYGYESVRKIKDKIIDIAKSKNINIV
jgi:hypothetical protein